MCVCVCVCVCVCARVRERVRQRVRERVCVRTFALLEIPPACAEFQSSLHCLTQINSVNDSSPKQIMR